MSGNTPNDQPRPSRWKLYFSLTFLALAGAAGTVAWIELQESNFQAEYFHQQARTSTWKLEPGADSGIWLPSSGPYEQRLGYAQLRDFLPRMAAAGFSVTAQARQSQGFRDIVGQGFFPIYREKSQAGLSILDRHDRPLYDSQYPRLQYASFEAIPPVLVEALLFIENRDLLDPAHPKHNPAVDWGRLARVAFGQALRQVNLGGGGRAGGSTLATQIEKFRLMYERLDLRPEHHLLEIGSGWGALAIHAFQPRTSSRRARVSRASATAR